MPTPIQLDTPRLRLLPWRPEHLAPFAALNADPEVMRHFPSTQTVEQTQASIDLWMGQFAQQGWSNWAVELKATGEFIGFIGLSVPRRVLPFSPCVEIGWRLARRFWGQGLASEGARACLRVGFEQLGLAEVVSFTALGNAPSRAVMARIGMRNTGQDFDHPALPEGHALRRHCLYRITREEWAAGLVNDVAGLDRDQPDLQEAWNEELRRRKDEVERGTVELIPGDQALARVRRAIGK